MATSDGMTFTQTLVASQGACFGHVRVWVPGSNPLKEMIVEFVSIQDWGGQAYAWGGQAYAWGAPVMSNDGQVSVFPLENLFGNNNDHTLQKIPILPDLPSWLTAVGQVYRFEAEGAVPDAGILFRYLARDVPPGYESHLRVYFSPDEGVTWVRQPTELDIYRNHASAQVMGEGIYLLIATVTLP